MNKHKEFCYSCIYNDPHNSRYKMPCNKCKVEEYSPSWYKEDNKCIDPSDEDLGLVLNCAVRYSLGRRTYVPGSVCDFITPLIPKLSDRTLWCLKQDVSSAYSYGDEKIDKPIWMKFLTDVTNEIDMRKISGN